MRRSGALWNSLLRSCRHWAREKPAQWNARARVLVQKLRARRYIIEGVPRLHQDRRVPAAANGHNQTGNSTTAAWVAALTR